MAKPPAPAGAHRCPACAAPLRLLETRGSHLILRCPDGHEYEWSSGRGYLKQAYPQRTERLAQAAYRGEFLTGLLRDSPTAVYASLRAALAGLGVQADEAVLTEFFQDGPAEHWGTLVTAGGRVLTFVLEADGVLTHEDHTDTWERVPHSAGVEAVLLGLDNR